MRECQGYPCYQGDMMMMMMMMMICCSKFKFMFLLCFWVPDYFFHKILVMIEIIKKYR